LLNAKLRGGGQQSAEATG